MNVIYVTYDSKLKYYLWRYKSIENILAGNHPKTNKPFWVYERNKKLENALKGWFNKT